MDLVITTLAELIIDEAPFMFGMYPIRITDMQVWNILSIAVQDVSYNIQDLEYIVSEAYRRACEAGKRISLYYNQGNTVWTIDYHPGGQPTTYTSFGWKAEGRA